MKPTVYVTQENQTFDFTQAEDFGEVVFLTAKELSSMPNSLMNANVVSEVWDNLWSFDSEQDFLLPVGSPLVSGLAFFLLGRNTTARNIKVLKWSNRDRNYKPYIIPIQG